MNEESLKNSLGYATQAQTVSPSGLGEVGSLRYDSLAARVERQLNQARSESERACRLDELTYLIKKYPEIARLIELLSEVK